MEIDGAIDDEWVQRWMRAVDGVVVPAETPDAVVAWTAGEVSWWARFADGAVAAGKGAPPEPATVTFAADAGTAAAIHRGELAGEDAVLDGRLVVRGDVVQLAALRPALDAVGEAARATG